MAGGRGRGRVAVRPGNDLGAPVGDQVDGRELLKTRTGSSELMMLTALVSRMRSVRAAAAPSTTAGAETM
jgi:hypothetical protein